jgi:hypothetical protein
MGARDFQLAWLERDAASRKCRPNPSRSARRAPRDGCFILAINRHSPWPFVCAHGQKLRRIGVAAYNSGIEIARERRFTSDIRDRTGSGRCFLAQDESP